MTAFAAILALLAMHGVSLVKAAVAEVSAEPDDAWPSVLSNVVGTGLLTWAAVVLVAMVQLLLCVRPGAGVSDEVTIRRARPGPP